MSLSAPQLKVDHVSVVYNNGHQALEDISFTLTGGTVCALVGINGSGKSTLFNAIMGIIRPRQGSVSINGEPAQQAVRGNAVSYVPQAEQIDWRFPVLVRDVVMQGRYGYMDFRRRARPEDYEIVARSLARMNIESLAARQIGELSGGQKKRVFLARALAQESKIILLDEPFTGVDVKTEMAIMDLLQSLRDDGYLILVSTHNLGSVPDYCNEVLMLNRRLIAQGDTQTTFTRNNLAATFGGVLKSVRLNTADSEGVSVVSDDERAAIFFGDQAVVRPHQEES